MCSDRTRRHASHLGILLSFAGSGALAQKPPPPPEPVAFSLVAETTALAPGDTAMIGLRFRLDPGWHLYWQGRSDTGLPPRVKVDLPPGCKAGSLLWPAPVRHVSPGKILDHVHENELLLMLPVHVLESAAPGDSLRFAAEADWVVCKEVCIFGKGRAQAVFPVAASPAPSSEALLFVKARERLPESMESAARELILSWNADELDITSPPFQRMEFYPFTDSAELIDPIADAVTETGRLRLRFRSGDERPARGLIALFHAASKPPRFFTVDSQSPSEN